MSDAQKITPILYEEFVECIHAFNEESVHDWNAHDLEGFCQGYADNAIMVTSAGMFKGYEAILQAYQEAYPDRSRMGTISAKVIDILFSPHNMGDKALALVSMAVAIVHCTVMLDGEVAEDGYSMVAYIIDHTGTMYIAQDTST